MPTHPPEPFRIKMVEPIKLINKADREKALLRAGYNIFGLKSDEVFIDLLTDSGTGAMSQDQWSGIMLGDESYAGARSFHRLSEAMADIFGFNHFVPTHQGRAAENILCAVILSEGQYVPSNMHFDTTEGNIRARGGRPTNLVCEEAFYSDPDIPFKGNMDLDKLENYINDVGPENINLTRYPFSSMPAVMQRMLISLNSGKRDIRIRAHSKSPMRSSPWPTVPR